MTSLVAPRPLRPLPGPLGGWTLSMWRDPVATLSRAWREGGDLAFMRVGPQRVVLLTHPAHVEHVLVSHHRNYSKQTRGYDALRWGLGEGMLTSEGDFWRRQRRIAQPSFHHRRIAGFASAMLGAADRMIAGWSPGGTIALDAAMSAVALEIAGRTLMSFDAGRTANVVGPAVEALLACAWADTVGIRWPRWAPVPRVRRAASALASLDAIIFGLIAERRGAPPMDDLLSMLMEARDEETGEGMSDRELRDELMTMFLAGHETTATALSWTLLEIAARPEVRERLLAEVDALGEGPLSVEHLGRLPYTEAVFEESLRLHPPVWLLARAVEEDDEIDGARIPAGSRVMLSPYLVHRHPELWPEPERFDPERFTPEAKRARPRGAYFPFSLGPRMCIGTAFAMMEGKLLLASILRRFTLERVGDGTIRAEPVITLRPRGDLRMRVVPR